MNSIKVSLGWLKILESLNNVLVLNKKPSSLQAASFKERQVDAPILKVRTQKKYKRQVGKFSKTKRQLSCIGVWIERQWKTWWTERFCANHPTRNFIDQPSIKKVSIWRKAMNLKRRFPIRSINTLSKPYK